MAPVGALGMLLLSVGALSFLAPVGLHGSGTVPGAMVSSDPVESRAADPPPSKPKNFQATATSSSRIDLSWDAVNRAEDGLKHYNLYRDGSRIAQVKGTSYSDGGLEDDRTYTYEVAAVDGKDREGARATATATTPDDDDDDNGGPDTTPPSSPPGFGGGAGSSTTVSLFWSPASDPESGIKEYRVYRDDRRVATVSGTSYRDTGLRPSTGHAYKVSAVNGADLEGPPAGPLHIQTPPDGTPPSTPGNVQAAAVDTSTIDVSWSASGDPESGIREYVVYRDDKEVARVGSTSYRDRGLRPGTAYDYEVSAVNGAGLHSGRGGPVTVSTPSGVDVTGPSRPGGVQAVPKSASRIDVTWSAASDAESGIQEYVVYRDGKEVARVGSTGYTDDGLSPSTTYSYEVSAVNGADLEGPRAGPATAVTPAARDASPPSAPSGLAASADGSAAIRLTWSAARDPDSGISGYRVYRDGQEAAFVSGTEYRDTGLAAETLYEYRVAAVNGDGVEGPRSSPESARTEAAVDRVPPEPPGGLRLVP